jgi:hypothetical protein
MSSLHNQTERETKTEKIKNETEKERRRRNEERTNLEQRDTMQCRDDGRGRMRRSPSTSAALGLNYYIHVT